MGGGLINGRQSFQRASCGGSYEVSPRRGRSMKVANALSRGFILSATLQACGSVSGKPSPGTSTLVDASADVDRANDAASRTDALRAEGSPGGELDSAQTSERNPATTPDGSGSTTRDGDGANRADALPDSSDSGVTVDPSTTNRDANTNGSVGADASTGASRCVLGQAKVGACTL